MFSIRSKILTFAVLATLIPSLSFGLLSYVHDERVIEGKVSQGLQSVAGFTSREVDLWLKERIYDLRAFASSYVISESLQALSQGRGPQTVGGNDGLPATQALQVFLASVQNKIAHYERLLVTGPNGAVVASSAEPAGTVHLPDGWLQQATTKGVVVGAPYWQDGGEQPVLMLAIPIFSLDNRLLGSLAAELNFHAVDDTLGGPGNAVAGEVLLLNRSGQVFLNSRHPAADLRGIALPAAALQALYAETGRLTEYKDSQLARMLGVLHPLNGLPLAILAQRAKADVFRELHDLRNLSIALIGGMLLVVGLVAYLFGLSIVRPLRQLISGAGKVAHGDLQVDLVPEGRDELGYMIRVFNQMVSHLRQNRDEIASVNRVLYEKNQILEELSITDTLTGLYNRKNLLETLSLQMERFHRNRRPFCVLMLDIDRFKELNDTYGHLAGDQVLSGVAAVLLRSIRSVDYAARYGGEEFLIMLFETGRSDALETAERIRSRVAQEPMPVDGGELSVTISIGVADISAADEDPNQVIQRADKALYQAKRSGRNRVCVAPGEALPAAVAAPAADG